MNMERLQSHDYMLIMYYIFMILQEDSVLMTQTLRTLQISL